MIGLSVADMQCEALFASELPQSDALTRDTVAEMISRIVQRIGIASWVGRDGKGVWQGKRLAVSFS